MRQLPCQYAYGQRQEFVLICLRSTDRPIDELYVQPLSLPDARTVLLPKSDNCRACTPAIYRPNDHANTPAIPIIVMPISLRPKHDQVELCSLEYNPIASTVLLVLEYVDRGYVVTCLGMAILRTKKELPVSEYIDRSYMVYISSSCL